jgi:hypothetical protein
MPKSYSEFTVECVEKPQRPFAHCVHLTDVGGFWELVELGFVELRGVPKGKCGGQVDIQVDIEDSRLGQALQILERSGFRPSAHLIVPPTAKEHEFVMLRHRVYSSAELGAARLLRLVPRFCQDEIADWIGGSDDHGWIVEAKAKGKRLQIGHFDSFEGILVGPELKATLEKEGLKGVNFLPAAYDKPSPSLRQLWQFGHKVLMPPCLLPRQDDDGNVVKESDNGGRYWDDGGYVPQELVFGEKEIAGMPRWDMAVTREKIGFHPGHYRSEVIVSQRFREVLLGAGIKTIGYAPVKVV